MGKRLFLLAAGALALSSCATIQRGQASVDRALNIISDVRSGVDAVLNRPAPLANTQVDESIIRSAYTRFDQGLTVIEALVDNGTIRRNSPTALRLRSAISIVLRGLQTARVAQRLGNAATVREALAGARTALIDMTTTLQENPR